jgi:hypothetical protein
MNFTAHQLLYKLRRGALAARGFLLPNIINTCYLHTLPVLFSTTLVAAYDIWHISRQLK